MTHMTKEETALLRQALGLSFYCRQNPTRNLLFLHYAEKYPEALASLLERGFLVKDSTIGQGGVEHFYKATDAGREGVYDQPWQS